MNKPVFETVIGEKVEISNMLEDTLAGGAATHISTNDTAPPPNDDATRAPALDLLKDEKDGRRSIEAVAAAQAVEPEQSVASLSVEPVSNSVIDPIATDFQVAKDDATTNVPAAVSPISSHVLSSEVSLVPKQESVLSVDQPSTFSSKETSSSATTAVVILINGSDDPAVPDSMDFRTGYDGLGLDVRLREGDDQTWAGGGNFSVDGGAGSDTIYGRFFYNPEGGFNGDHYWGGGGFDTVNYGFEQQSNGARMWFDGYAANYNRLLTNGRSYVESDVEKIVGVDTAGATNTQGDAFLILAKYDTPTRSWYWAGMGGYDDLKSGLGGDTLDGGADGDVLQGGAGQDFLYGSKGFDDGVRDILWGGEGNDRLEGSFGDILIGDSGNDILVGGWAFYDDYTYTSVVGGSSYNFTYSSSASRTVNLNLGTVVSGTEVDMLSNVWQVATGGGNDVLIAAGFNAWLRGGGGSDQLYGGGANDTLLGGTGFDFFYGSAGSDSIDGDADGGVVDYISLSGSVEIDLSAGTTKKSIGGTDTISNIDHAQGTNSNDRIIGNGNANSLLGAGGDDFFDGRGGNDIINGNAGNDSIAGGDEHDMLYGEDGNDTLDGGNGNDELHGWIDQDSLTGGAGNDKLYGESGLDTLEGGADADTLDGGDHNDFLQGGTGNDSLIGGSGNDTLIGGAGVDTMDGGVGDDEYWVDDPGDIVVEGAVVGVDLIRTMIDYDLGLKAVYVENLTAIGSADVKLTGNAGHNIIIGNNGANIIKGGLGNDTMKGGFGNDTYYIDDLTDVPQEFNTTVEGSQDKAIISVKNFDARKLANIEIIETIGGGTVDRAPVFSSKSDTDITINELTSNIDLHVIATDDGNGGTIGYQLLSHADKFDINANGDITLKAPIDYETTTFEFKDGKAFLRLIVQATESETTITSDPYEITVWVEDSNDAPTGITYGTLEVDEDAPTGQPISAIPTVSDPDAPEAFRDYRYELLDLNGNPLDDTAMFVIDPMTGVIKRGNGDIPDVTEPTDYQFRVRVTDVGGGENLPYTSESITITVNPVANRRPDAPQLVTDPPEIMENITGFIGQVTSYDDGNGGSIRYRLVTGDDNFDISDTGEITVSVALNFETLNEDEFGNRYVMIEVQAYETDGGLESEITPIKVIVTNQNEAPDSLLFMDGTTAASVQENQRGFKLGGLLGHDPDEGDQLTYYFKEDQPNDNPGGRFTIVNNELRLVDGAALDWDEATSYTVRVYAKDQLGLETYTDFTINVTQDPNEPIDFINQDPDSLTFTNHLTEVNARAGVPNALIGMLLASDPNPEDSGQLRFQLIADPSEKFMVTPNGVVQLREGKSLDLITDAERKIIVRVWDAHGGFLDQELTIHTVAPNGNTPPQIQITGNIDFEIQDVATTAPFKNLVFSDAEDDATDPATPITVLISFTGQNTGKFENLPSVPLPVGIDRFDYTEDHSILVKGTHDAVTNILKLLQFNPDNKPAGVDVTTDFLVTVFDSSDTPSEQVHVTVEAHGTGLGDNHSPIIEIDPNGTPVDPEVSDLATFSPLKNLIFKDQDVNDTLTVTVSWLGAGGAFDVTPEQAAAFGVTIEEVTESSFRVTGSQEGLTNFFKVAQFAPADFPNDPTGQGHPITFSVDVMDQHDAHDSLDLNYSVVTENRAPDGVALSGGTIDNPILDDAGVGQEIGTLTGNDPNGDAITAYRLVDSADDRFTIKQVGDLWAVVVNGDINFDTLPDTQKVPDSNIGWYEILVAATDEHGKESDPIAVRIYVHDVEPENSAPMIWVDPNNPQTEWPVVDTDTVAPFQNLTFFDAEDANPEDPKPIIVVIQMDNPNNGVFVRPDEAGFPDLEIQLGEGVIAVIGLQGRVTEYIKLLAFNPANSFDPANSPVPMDFQVLVYDSAYAWSQMHVTVNTTVTNGVDNVAPTIHVEDDKASTPTTDWGQPVNPFQWVQLEDTDSGSDMLTLTITFKSDEGKLDGTVGGSRFDDNGRVTWTFVDTLENLRNRLQNLTFDAKERDQAGEPVTTTFTITLDDGHHAFPASNNEVNVVTTVTGPTGMNNVYHVWAVDETSFGEPADPALGGIDKAFVHITEHYVLDDDEGIETLEAADDAAFVDMRGNNLDNTLIGGDGDDILDGGSAGQDVLRGGNGDDTYIVSRQNVVVEDVANDTGGTDTIKLDGAVFDDDWAAYTLGEFIENLDAGNSDGVVILNGNALGNVITGNDDGNILNGFDGNDILDGGAGGTADRLEGGTGDDVYKIRHAADAIVEGAGDAFDTAEIYLHDAYRLVADAQVEVLRAGDGFTEGVHLIGNAYSWNILGSGVLEVSDTLDGGTGTGIIHVLSGGDGNDTYYIVNVDDEIFGEIEGENGKAHGDADIAYLYRGLYATKELLDEKIAYYLTQGIETVEVLNDVMPEGPDNAAPTNVRLPDDSFEASLAENSEGDTGILVVADDEDIDGLTFEIFENDAFGIDADTGQIFVLDESKLDREQVESIVVHVRARDADGLVSAWRDITIYLDDVNEAADSIDFTDQKTVYVGNGGGTLVVKAVADDLDVTDTNRINFYRFHNGQGPDGTISADGLFTIDKVTGQVTVSEGKSLDEAIRHDLEIIAYDSTEPDLVSQVFKYEVVVQDGGENSAPTGIQLSQDIVREFSASGTTLVGDLIVIDEGDSGPWQVDLIDDAGGRFALEGSREIGWRIVVADGIKLDYEQDTSHVIKLKVTDSGDAQSELIDVQIFVENMLVESVVGNDDGNVIKAGGQDDNLSGGGGDDFLHGGGGNDVLNGGDGADTFVFDVLLDPTAVVEIQDFDPTQDKIQLSSVFFQGLLTTPDGTVDPNVFFSGSDPQGDFQLLYDETSGALVFDPDGFSGEAPSVVFAFLSNLPLGFQLNNTHFIVI